MVNEPSVDELIRKLGSEEDPLSRYALCAVAANAQDRFWKRKRIWARAMARQNLRNFPRLAWILQKAE